MSICITVYYDIKKVKFLSTILNFNERFKFVFHDVQLKQKFVTQSVQISSDKWRLTQINADTPTSNEYHVQIRCNFVQKDL